MDKKKDGKQQYRVRLNYTDSNGKQHQIDRVAYGSAEAKMLETKLKSEYKGTEAANSILTVSELYSEYMNAKRTEVRRTTYEKTQQKLDLYVIPYAGTIKLNKLNSRALQDWKNKISALKLAVSTRQHIYGEFRAMLNYAVKMEYIPKNPLVAVGNFRNPYF